MNDSKHKVSLFDRIEVRQLGDDKTETRWSSVVDVIEILGDQPSHNRARTYWSLMKIRLKQEGAELTKICRRLKMEAADDTRYLTDREYGSCDFAQDDTNDFARDDKSDFVQDDKNDFMQDDKNDFARDDSKDFAPVAVILRAVAESSTNIGSIAEFTGEAA